MVRAAALALLAMQWAGTAAAHPHGRLACQVQLVLEGGQLVAVRQRLTLDTASSAALAERVQPAAAEPAKPVAQFRGLLLGLFRQSAWMLELRAEGAAEAVVLDDSASGWRQLDDGRLELSLTLAPAAPVRAASAWSVACRDPSWYWVGEFAGTEPVSTSGMRCTALLDGPRDAAAEAAALSAAAQAAGKAGAEQVAPATTAAPQLGAGRAELRC